MRNTLENDKEEKALSVLALSLLRAKQGTDEVLARVQGDMPSDEDLAAFYEGKLEVARSAQVQSHIAHDPSVYSMWLSFVEMADLLGIEPAIVQESELEHGSSEHITSEHSSLDHNASEHSAIEQDKLKQDRGVARKDEAENKAGIWTQLLSNLKAWFGKENYGAGWAFAAVAGFAVLINIQTQQVSIEQLYDDYGVTQADGQIQLPSRAYNPFAKPPQDEAVVISEGVYQGIVKLEKIGQVDDIVDLHRYRYDASQALEQLSVTDQGLYRRIGLWGALVFYHCGSQLNLSQSKDIFVDKAEIVHSELMAEISQLDTDFAKIALGKLQAPLLENQHKLCLAANGVIELAR